MTPRMTDLKESRTLTKEDVDPPVVMTISGFVRETIGPEGQQEDKWIMDFKESKKGLVLNVTNNDILTELFGNHDIEDYFGKKIVLYSDPNVMFAGKKVGGIRIRAPEKDDKPAFVDDTEIPF